MLKGLFSVLTLLATFVVCGCTPPPAQGVGVWDGRNHQITATVSQGSGLSGVRYVVQIDEQVVINEDISRSQQSPGEQVLFSADGRYNGSLVRAEYEQSSAYGQLFIRNKIYVDGDLVAVITP